VNKYFKGICQAKMQRKKEAKKERRKGMGYRP